MLLLRPFLSNRMMFPYMLVLVSLLSLSGSVFANKDVSLYVQNRNGHLWWPTQNHINIQGNLTIEIWVKPLDMSIDNDLFSSMYTNFSNNLQDGGFTLAIGKGSNGKNRVLVYGVGTQGGFGVIPTKRPELIFESVDDAIQPGQWNRITYVRTGSGASDQKVYVNGQEVGVHASSAYSFQNSTEFFIAPQKGTGLDGFLADIRIWEVARSATDIQNSLFYKLTGNEAHLAGYITFETQTSVGFSDLSPNKNAVFSSGSVVVATDYPHVQAFPSQSLHFSSPGYVDIEHTNQVDFSKPFTVEFWIKPTDLNGRRPVFSTRKVNVSGGFEIEVGSGQHENGVGRVTVTGPSTFVFESVDNAIQPDRWNHVAYIKTGNAAADQKLYVNGTAVAAATTNAFTVTNNANDYRLGGNYTGSMHFLGLLYDLRLWNAARSQTQVTATMNVALTGTESGLGGYWPLNEGIGTLIYDMSTHTNTGAFSTTGMSWSTDVPGSSIAGITGIDVTALTASQNTATVTTGFSIFGQSLTPMNLTLEYTPAQNRFAMYGTVEFAFEKESITAVLGDASEPGLIIENGTVKEVALGITADFKVAGLEVKTNNLGMEWKNTSGVDEFHIYGDADIIVEDSDLDADFGTINDPGIIVRAGRLWHFGVDINADIKLGSVEFKTKDLDLVYDRGDAQYSIKGEAEFDAVFDVIVDFGKDDTPGIIVDVSGAKPRFKVEDITIEVDHLNLGTIDLKQLKVEFNSSGIEEADVDVVFAKGDEIGGKLVFDSNPVRLNTIDIFYRADNLEDGIELFEGVQVAYMDAEVVNLDHPHDLRVSGEIQIYAGGGLTFDGYSAAMLEAGAKAVIDKTKLEISTELNVGAYRVGDSNSWHHVLGRGTGSFGIYFQKKAVTASVSTQLPVGTAFVEIDESFWIGVNDLAFLADVKLFVPDDIPFIGGKTLASIDGAVFQYRNRKVWSIFANKFVTTSGGYAAGWTSIAGIEVGAKFDFNSKSVSKIGSGSISSIKDDWTYATKSLNAGSGGYTNTAHTFELPQPAPNTVILDARWFQPIDTVLITIMGPEGFYEVQRMVITNPDDKEALPEITMYDNTDLITADTSAMLMFTFPTNVGENTLYPPPMTAGRYQMVLSFPSQVPDTSAVEVLSFWEKPSIDFEAVKQSDHSYLLEANIWSTLRDSANVTFFVTDSTNLTNGRVIGHVVPRDFDLDNFASVSLEYEPDFISDDDRYYFYAIVDDGVNPPVKSVLTEAFQHAHDISGILHFPAAADTLKEGIRVFLDLNNDGNFNTASTGGLEPFGVSHSDGEYHILNVEPGTYPLRAILPRGYRIKGTAHRLSSVEVTYADEPVTLNLDIEPYSEN